MQQGHIWYNSLQVICTNPNIPKIMPFHKFRFYFCLFLPNLDEISFLGHLVMWIVLGIWIISGYIGSRSKSLDHWQNGPQEIVRYVHWAGGNFSIYKFWGIESFKDKFIREVTVANIIKQESDFLCLTFFTFKYF